MSYATDCQIAGFNSSGKSSVWAKGVTGANNITYGGVSFGGFLHIGLEDIVGTATVFTGNALGVAPFNGGKCIMPDSSAHPANTSGNPYDGVFVSDPPPPSKATSIRRVTAAMAATAVARGCCPRR